MKYLLGVVLAGLALVLSGRIAHADGVVPGYVLVKPDPKIDLRQVAAQYGVKIEDRINGTTIYRLSLPAGQTPQTFAATLQRDKRLIFAEVDTYLLNPEVKGDPAHLAFDFAAAATATPPGDVTDQTALPQIRLSAAWQRTTGKGVTVAVLDTGATFSNPFLNAHYLPGFNVLAPNTFPIERADGITNAAVGHGTMVAGIIALVAPDAKILPIRVLNGDGLGTAMGVAKGVMYALQNGAQVANLSLGSAVESKALSEAMDAAERAGMACVVAAGNDGRNTLQFPGSRREVLVVGAVEANNTLSPYSTYGRQLSVVAPGTNIRSTYGDGYASWSGTSFAAPFVAGELALLRALQPNLTLSQLKDLVCGTALSLDKLNPSYKAMMGKGLIQIDSAIAQIAL